MASFVLAIDQGTTSTRAIVFGADMSVAGLAQQEFPQHFPADGEVEHDPEDLWSSTVATCREAMRKAGATASDVAAIGITNQRETTLVWDRATGQPLHRAIVWQDRRTADACSEPARTRPRTGLRGQDRTFARSLFLRHQACVAARSCAGRTGAGRARRPRLRHGRLVPVMATHRRQGARNRCHQRVAHVAVRHSSRPLGRRTLGAARRAEKCPAGRARFVRRFRRDGSGAVRRTDSDLRHRRRSAGGADRTGLFHARHGQIDLRHRMLRRAQYRQHAGRIQQQTPDDDRLSTRRRTHLCARRLDLRRRCGGAMAARQSANRRQCGGDRRARRSSRSDARRHSGAGLRRPRRTLLAAGRARRFVWADARHRSARNSRRPRSTVSVSRPPISSPPCGPTGRRRRTR